MNKLWSVGPPRDGVEALHTFTFTLGMRRCVILDVTMTVKASAAEHRLHAYAFI